MKKTKLIFCLILLAAFAVAAVLGVGFFQKMIYPQKFSDSVSKYSADYSVPEHLVYAVIYTESKFDPDAVSNVGAKGLMQLMPDTLSWLSRLMGEEERLELIFDPDTNIRYGTYYLRHLYDRFGSWDTALAAYNAGHGRVAGWLKDKKYSDDGINLKEIPIEETRNFVKRVNSAQKKYIKLYYGDQT